MQEDNENTILNFLKSKNLTKDDITFGKYKGLKIEKLLRDPRYCNWLLEQPELVEKYAYISDRIKNHNIRDQLVTKPKYKPITEKFSIELVDDFLKNYEYFHMVPTEEVKVELNDTDKICYAFYLEMMENIKNRIINNKYANSFDIKAPTKWLLLFETKTKLSRDIFKEFTVAYELPNITEVVEYVKKMGGLEYKGRKSFQIAKKNSAEQEKFWSQVLKEVYQNSIGSSYKYEKCIFDFINFDNKTIYECKLDIKYFNQDQHNKYTTMMPGFSIIYLISNDCIVDIAKKKIYTISPDKYMFNENKKKNKLEYSMKEFQIISLNEIKEYFPVEQKN